ncbi:hypothetical protein Golax_003552, partial [Gossypium laxum]|nr:hypothetical protein [Gossypium laxum]
MAGETGMEQLTSGASNRIIPILRTLRIPLIFLQSIILYLLLFLFPRRRQTAVGAADEAPHGRYTQFAKQLTSCRYGVYAMDWIGHGGSDGLHGYVPSLDHVVADTGFFLEKIKTENPGVPCFLFGHSTGGAVVLKAASYPHIEEMVEGIVLTSPALRVRPAHPIVR